jgi:hypothetical protein
MQDSMGANDICLGVAKFVPNLDQMGSADEWYEFSNGTGRIQVCTMRGLWDERALTCPLAQIGWSYQPANNSLTIDNFELITVIGKGSFGKVGQDALDVLQRADSSLTGHASQEDGHGPDLRDEDDLQGTHRRQERDHAHARRAHGARARQLPVHRAPQVQLPVQAEAVPRPRVRATPPPPPATCALTTAVGAAS